jgi:hypothetical protein
MMESVRMGTCDDPRAGKYTASGTHFKNGRQYLQTGMASNASTNNDKPFPGGVKTKWAKYKAINNRKEMPNLK